MIKTVTVTSGFASELKALKGKTFSFKPGLNILYGPNGCGKSTLLKIMAAYCGVNKGGWSRVNEPLSFGFGEELTFPNSYAKLSPGECKAVVEWDGTPTYLHRAEDSDVRTSSTFYGSVSDSPDGETTMTEQLNTMLTKPSSGQLRGQKLQKFFEACKTPKQRLPKKDAKKANSVWDACEDAQYAYFASLKATGIPTLMADEPENSMDIPSQLAIWANLMPQLAHPSRQIIIATHSVSALFVPCQSNIIDVIPGYAETCSSLTALYVTRPKHADMMASLQKAFDKLGI